MNERLVIPKNMRENLMNAIHFGHPGRDAMLRDAADVWWPKIHREIIEKASNCPQCRLEGKNLKFVKSQKEFGDHVIYPPPRYTLLKIGPPPLTTRKHFLFSNKTISLITEYYMKVNTYRTVSTTVLTLQAKTCPNFVENIVQNSRNARLKQAKIV